MASLTIMNQMRQGQTTLGRHLSYKATQRDIQELLPIACPRRGQKQGCSLGRHARDFVWFHCDRMYDCHVTTTASLLSLLSRIKNLHSL